MICCGTHHTLNEKTVYFQQLAIDIQTNCFRFLEEIHRIHFVILRFCLSQQTVHIQRPPTISAYVSWLGEAVKKQTEDHAIYSPHLLHTYLRYFCTKFFWFKARTDIQLGLINFSNSNELISKKFESYGYLKKQFGWILIDLRVINWTLNENCIIFFAHFTHILLLSRSFRPKECKANKKSTETRVDTFLQQ